MTPSPRGGGGGGGVRVNACVDISRDLEVMQCIAMQCIASFLSMRKD